MKWIYKDDPSNGEFNPGDNDEDDKDNQFVGLPH